MARSAGVVMIKSLIFLEPTAPPQDLLMLHPARTKAGSSVARTLCATFGLLNFTPSYPQTTLLISAEYG